MCSSTNQSSENAGRGNGVWQIEYFIDEGWGEVTDYRYPSMEFHYQQREEQQQPFFDRGMFHGPRYDMLTPPLQTCPEEIAKVGEIQSGSQEGVEPRIEQKDPLSLTSLKLLKDYGNGFKRLSGDRIIQPTNETPCAKATSEVLSTEEIMKIAGERLVRSSAQIIDIAATLNNPFDLSLSRLPDEVAQQVQLAEVLLASAEKVDDQQFDRAARLLEECDRLSSSNGNPVQRVVYYFSKALRHRIDQEKGKTGIMQSINIEEALMAPTPNNLASHLEIPFSQVAHFAGVQAILDHVGEATRIHVIDLGIRIGMQWTVLMQALASRYDCPLELLKITAIGTTMKHLIENTRKRLVSFAETINLPIAFNIIMVSDFLDLKEDHFELDAEETVAVYSEYLLRSLIPQPDRLDSLMKVIRHLNPCVMVVVEAEYNSTSAFFANRFIEALCFFSAYFDCLDVCMKRDDPNRMAIEAMHFGEGIRSILAREGEERKIQNVKIDVWRAFFSRFAMEEIELSTSSLYQAKLIVKTFSCGNFCTLRMDGNTLLIGWKGTPLFSISAWKFIYQE